MKNIKIPKRVEKSIVRFAYLDLIETSMRKIMFKGTSHLDLGGYENDADRVHFTYDGKRCMLQGVWLPNLDADKPSKLSLSVFVFKRTSKNSWSWNQLRDVTIDLRDMRFKTLDRIAYEVYDYCKGENDDDYEEARRDCIAGWMDNYREFMS